MELEKNIYGLSEGVFKACQFLGLKFPEESLSEGEHVPSDYFGEDFEFDEETKEKLCAERKWTKEKFEQVYKIFSKAFASRKLIKHNKTDLNIYFCDHVLFDIKQNGASSDDYFAFEFYNKSFALRDEFINQTSRNQMIVICNEHFAIDIATNKRKANSLFNEFLRRDWIYTGDCTFEEFKVFIEKHPRFFSKLSGGNQGKGAEIISVGSNDNLEKIFAKLKSKNRILEEVVKQHEAIAAFCSDTVNTIRVYTLLDAHNVVHILATVGRFGKKGGVVDNVHGGGCCSVTIDSKTGIITSDGLNNVHERLQKHPDSGKIFKGFQYPTWKKVCAVVKTMAKMIPQLRYLGWDIAVDVVGEPVLIEVNGNAPAVDLMQAADSVGRLPLYKPLIDELKKDKADRINRLGYQVNTLRNFDSSYYGEPIRKNLRLKFALGKLIPDCKSLLDLGCRESKAAKAFCPKKVKYIPVDFKKHDDEVILCDFNDGEFPDIKADTCLCAFTAEYVENLPLFINNMCNAAQKQILMWCRPFDKEVHHHYRWYHPFLTDFTEEFLIKSMEQNNFRLNMQYQSSVNHSIIFYDFRRN